MDLMDKTALVYDGGGLFPHVAQMLAGAYGRVMYFVPWTGQGFPTSKKRMVGEGLPGVEHIYYWLTRLHEADLVVFPDVYCADEVMYCRSLGKPTWGAGAAEVLEIERAGTKRLMEASGMPVVPYQMIEGVEPLREFLEDKEDLYIKGSITRGDFETRHHINAKLTAPWLDELKVKIGPRHTAMEFVVEQSVEGCEIGFDGYNIDGDFGEVCSYGYEIKDQGYVGKVSLFAELPAPIRRTCLMFSQHLAALGCRGFFSNEIRVNKDNAFLIDPTLRAGRPPSESYVELFENWPEVIWYGSLGRVIPLKARAQFSAEIILKSDWVREHYLSVDVPDSVARWVKICNGCVIDGQRYVIPQEDPEFGAAIGLGETLEEAIEMAKRNASKVEALDLTWREDVFDAAQECIEQGREVGINF